MLGKQMVVWKDPKYIKWNGDFKTAVSGGDQFSAQLAAAADQKGSHLCFSTLKSGQPRSRSDIRPTASGQSMAKDGSSQRYPLAAAGS